MMAAALTAAMTLAELLGPVAAVHSDLEINDLVLDSRQATAGAGFVAVPGGREHGLRYADDALSRGASVVLYEPCAEFPVVPEPSVAIPELKSRIGELARTFYGDCGEPAELVGITGTNGKTTVAYLIAQALSMQGINAGYIGTLGFGQLPDLSAHALTTPDCLTLHRELFSMDASHVALEVSSHALDQDRCAGLKISHAVFTNLTRDHLDQHGDFEAYARAKARLFKRPELQRAVLNLDDSFAQTLLHELKPTTQALGVSLVASSSAELVGRVRERGFAGIELEVSGRRGQAHISSRLIGSFNGENLLLALGALVALDRPLVESCAALSDCRAPPGRMDVIVSAAGQPHVVVDYAHTPDALERVLSVLGETAAGQIWCVFGCGGERDRGKRELMGTIAARAAAHIVITDDNPRNEDPATIVADIEAGLGEHPSVVVEHARDAAIFRAVHAAKSGDVVLIAGKGHETSQTIGGRKRPFDDRAVAVEALGGRS